MSSKDKETCESEDLLWIIDSLVQFLSGPVWNKPIAAFIEKKSAIFEPDTENEFTPEHYKVHKEYRNLVDSLLGGFVEEMQISPIQFQQAVSCGGPGETSALARFQPGALLEQVWAASDLTTFSQLMGLRNLELQLEALDSLRNRSNLEILGDDPSTVASEERLLKHVLRRSMEESSLVERMKKMNRMSLVDNMLGEDRKHAANPDLNIKSAQPSSTQVSANIATNTTEKQEKPKEVREAKQSSGSTHTTQKTTEKSASLTDEEIQKRKEYLCQQRDRLLQAKGRSIKPEAEQSLQPENETAQESCETEQAMQLRKALVTRLKAEVIKKP